MTPDPHTDAERLTAALENDIRALVGAKPGELASRLVARGWVIEGWLAAAPVPSGTETNCPIEGVHEHAFRGPHRFREWEPGT